MNMQSKQRTLFKGGIVVTMDKQTPNLPQGDVLVEGERIAAVGIFRRTSSVSPSIGIMMMVW
jgi:5-methylthioadenosine/S-adenosylhomocysteine deaminase